MPVENWGALAQPRVCKANSRASVTEPPIPPASNQFEQERLLQLFEDKKKQYFAIFPEEALKMIEDQAKDQ